MLATSEPDRFDTIYLRAQEFRKLKLKPKEEDNPRVKTKVEDDKMRATTSGMLNIKFDSSHLLSNRGFR